MHRNKYPIMDAYAVLYIFLPLEILAKMKHGFRGQRVLLKGDVQTL